MTATIHPLLAKFAMDDLLERYEIVLVARRDAGELIESHIRSLCELSMRIPDEVMDCLEEISRHDDPQLGPQEYECGCVTITRITDRDARRAGEKPFEMRLAIVCDGPGCEVPR